MISKRPVVKPRSLQGTYKWYLQKISRGHIGRIDLTRYKGHVDMPKYTIGLLREFPHLDPGGEQLKLALSRGALKKHPKIITVFTPGEVDAALKPKTSSD